MLSPSLVLETLEADSGKGKAGKLIWKLSTRILTVVQMVVWGGASFGHMRPLLGGASAALFALNAAVDLAALRVRE